MTHSPHHPAQPRPNAAVPTLGRTRLRVRYCECDPMGVAHHAAYAPWLEIGRTELLRETGVTYAHLEKQGVLLVITRLECSYRRPVCYDDLIEIRTTVARTTRVKIEHEYELVLIEDGGHSAAPPAHRDALVRSADPLMTASTTLACLDAGGRPQPLPDWLHAPRPA